jgi:hypothetical protein
VKDIGKVAFFSCLITLTSYVCNPVPLLRRDLVTDNLQLGVTGLVFNYLNTKEIFDKFCGTYEALYDLLGEFDDWYTQNGSGLTIPSLQKEWKDYNREVLDSAVRRSRATLKWMYENKRYVFPWPRTPTTPYLPFCPRGLHYFISSALD